MCLGVRWCIKRLLCDVEMDGNQRLRGEGLTVVVAVGDDGRKAGFCSVRVEKGELNMGIPST